MAKRIPVEKAIRILREVEVLQGQGNTLGEACQHTDSIDWAVFRHSSHLRQL